MSEGINPCGSGLSLTNTSSGVLSTLCPEFCLQRQRFSDTSKVAPTFSSLSPDLAQSTAHSIMLIASWLLIIFLVTVGISDVSALRVFSCPTGLSNIHKTNILKVSTTHCWKVLVYRNRCPVSIVEDTWKLLETWWNCLQSYTIRVEHGCHTWCHRCKSGPTKEEA